MAIHTRDRRHLTLTSDKMRAIIHEAWKHGNESYNIHEEPAGNKERFDYVDQVMIEKGFKQEA